MRKYNRAPTQRQIKALQLINQGYSVHRAMKEAGYSKSSLKLSYKFKKSPIVQKMMTNLNSTLYEKGLTTEFMADKFMEWLNAKKPFTSHTEEDRDVPDYDTQIKAYDRVKEVINPQKHEGGIKRKLEITEFITGEENPDAPQ